MKEKTQLMKQSPSEIVSSNSLTIAIKENVLSSYLQKADIADEVNKSNCIYDLVNVEKIPANDIKKQLIDMLVQLNLTQSKTKQLTDVMIMAIVDMLFTDFNGMSIVGFYKCIKKGMQGGYGKFYQLDVSTVGGWIHQYNHDAEYAARIQELRERSARKNKDELLGYPSKYVEALRKALGERKPAEYVPRQSHLDQFKQVLKLYSDDELVNAELAWSKRQRPAYLKLILEEKLARKQK